MDHTLPARHDEMDAIVDGAAVVQPYAPRHVLFFALDREVLLEQAAQQWLRRSLVRTALRVAADPVLEWRRSRRPVVRRADDGHATGPENARQFGDRLPR